MKVSQKYTLAADAIAKAQIVFLWNILWKHFKAC